MTPVVLSTQMFRKHFRKRSYMSQYRGYGHGESWPDYHRFQINRIFEGPLGKILNGKTGKSINSCKVSGGDRRCKWNRSKFCRRSPSWIHPKRSQIAIAVIFIALSLAHLSARLSGVPTQSWMESFGTLPIFQYLVPNSKMWPKNQKTSGANKSTLAQG